MPLTLIGYRATGKTTLAKLLAERFGCPWADSDDEIERSAGKTIAAIFAEDGEPAFRELEARAIADLCRRDPLILATGGGAPLLPENRRAMREAGRVIWLRAESATIHARMINDESTAARRPPLSDSPPMREIVRLLEARTPIYEQTADIAIDTDGFTPEELADTIVASLHSDKNLNSGIPNSGN
ncbi:MAG: shikimate kinase [Pirellulaceae bacterium]|nr:shikimate kinase [Pirellulaceae bacterium]